MEDKMMAIHDRLLRYTATVLHYMKVDLAAAHQFSRTLPLRARGLRLS